MEVMEIAKVTSNGQLTLPTDVRKKLNLKDGDRLAFVETDGFFKIFNPTALAIEKIQNDFDGEADRLGLKEIEDVVCLVKDMRMTRDERHKYACNA